MQNRLASAAFGGATATLFWQAIRVLLILVSVVTLSRLLPPAMFGLVAMVTAIVSIGDILRDFGLSTASIQATSISQSEKTNLFWLNTTIGAVLTVIVYALAVPISMFYDNAALIEITQVLSLTFLANGLSAQFRAQINRDLRFNTLGFLDAGPQLLGLGVAIVGALVWNDARALLAQQLTIAFAGLALAIILARWRPSWPSRSGKIGRFLRFGAGLLGTQATAYVSKNVDTVAIGLVASATAVGLYARAYQLVLLPLNQLTAPLSRVAIPILSRVKDVPDAFSRYLFMGQFVGGVGSGLIYGLMFGLAGPLVEILLGSDWMGAVPLVQALALGGCFRAMGQVPYWIFISKGRTGSQFRFYLVAQPLLSGIIVLGVFWGALGVAVAGSIGFALFWYAQTLWAGRSLGMSVRGLIRYGTLIFAVIPVPIGVGTFLLTLVINSAWLSLVVGSLAASAYMALVGLLFPYFRGNYSSMYSVYRTWRRK